MIPQSNATLTQIAGGGLSEDEGGSYVASADTAKWSGSVPAYVHEEVLAVAGPEGLNEARQTYLVIPGDLSPSVTVLPEDTVTFTYEAQSRTRTVRHVAAHLLRGHMRTAKLYLRDV